MPMTIEYFEGTYPADEAFGPDFTKLTEGIKESPIRLLANSYRIEGINGMALTDPDKLHGDNPDIDEAVIFMRNYSGIYLGNTLIAIEDMISTQTFDQESYFSSLREDALKGNRRLDLPPSPTLEELSRADVDRMIMVARKDKTFAVFFNDGLILLPRSLQSHLQDTKILSSLRSLTLPGYSDRARLLIAHKARLRAQANQATTASI